jgi:hypothetical protein
MGRFELANRGWLFFVREPQRARKHRNPHAAAEKGLDACTAIIAPFCFPTPTAVSLEIDPPNIKVAHPGTGQVITFRLRHRCSCSKRENFSRATPMGLRKIVAQKASHRFR